MGDDDNVLLFKIAQMLASGGGGGGSGVSSFNTRTGAVVLLSADVTTALGFTPAVAGSGVTSFNTRTGAVTLTSGDVTTALGFTPENLANKSIDGTFAANSDTLYPSQKAAKTYADAGVRSFNTRTGAVTLSSGDVTTALGFTPLSQAAGDVRYVLKAGDTMTGKLQFSGTTHVGLRLNNLTTAQRDAVAGPTAGDLIWNTTTSQVDRYDGATWAASGTGLYVLKAGDTMTGALTIGNGVLAASAPVLSLSQTWNNAGVTFTGALLNITDTASTSGSFLFDVQKDALSKFHVTNAGTARFLRQDQTNTAFQLFLRKTGNSVSSAGAIASGGGLGTLFFSGFNGTANVQSSSIQAIAAEAFSGTVNGTRLDLFTTPIGTNTAIVALSLLDTGAAAFRDGTAALPGVTFASDTDTGLYRVGANSLGVSVAGALALTINATNLISVGAILAPDGTAALPGISFSGGAGTTGLYRISAGNLGFSAAGVLALTLNSTSLISVGTIWAPDGTAALPSFSFSGGSGVTGMYRISAGNLGFSASGVLALTINSTSLISVGTVLGPNGTAALPAFSFASDTDTGFYRVGANTIGLSVNGASVLSVDSSGIALASTSALTVNGSNYAANASLNGDLTVPGGSAVNWTSRAKMNSPASGNIKLSNSGATDFGLLQFGGTTSSFPAIKRNGAALNFRLADDSADCAITAADITSSAALHAASASKIEWSGRSIMLSPGDGVIELTNTGITDFNRLQFGGTTSSFPSIKRSTTTLQFRLADDSAFCGISTAAIVMATAAPLSVTSGTNQRAGNAVLVGGTVTVNNTTVTANTIVILTRKTSGGTIGTGITYTVSAATSFTINSDNILDTSTFSYLLIEVP